MAIKPFEPKFMKVGVLTAALQELASHQKVLQALQEALIKLKQGQSLDPSTSGGARLTVADILES